MKKQQIEQLISRFFDGETTRSEEQQLYDFFLHNDVPADLQPYASTILSLAARLHTMPEAPAKTRPLLSRWAIAASIAAILCLGVAAAGIFFIKNSILQTASPSSTISTEATEAETPKHALFVFDNVEMQEIADTLGQYYKVQPVFESEEAKHVRLYFQVEKSKSIKEVVELLNHFSKVSVKLQDKQLIIK